jgi:mono/diheme cytochrome c family protein
MVLGRRVYNNCMSCHQKDGSGVAGNYPPLAGSEWIQEPAEVLAALVLHGLQGPIEVRGEAYNQVMPAWSHLTDDQIAAVLTYIRASWGNSAPPVDAGVVAGVRQSTSDRREPWTHQELNAFGSSVETVEAAGTT